MPGHAIGPLFNRRKVLASAITAPAAIRLPPGHRQPVATRNGHGATAALTAQGLPATSAVVTSNRLPITGIGADQVQPLLNSQVTNWQELGCAVSLPVSVFGLDSIPTAGVTPAESVPDYPGLVAKLEASPGGVAIVSLDQIDMQVKVLDINGESPLLQAGSDTAPITKIGFGGDILFGRNVGKAMRKYDDFTFPMLQLKDLLHSFDLTICNWECFVSETIAPPEEQPGGEHTLDFVTEPPAIDGVLMSGIDAVSMANNHAFFSEGNFGPEAFYDTVKYLDEAALPHFGAGRNLAEARKPYTVEVNGVSIAILGIDGVTAMDEPDFAGKWSSEVFYGATEDGPGTNPLNLANITSDVSSLANQYDVVIPFFHMGLEYVWVPRDFEIQVTNACIDAGATAVVTSHPHTIMGMHTYKGKPVFHGLGNLVYDQMFSADTRTGYILDLTLRGKNIIGFRIHGFENFDFCQCRLMPPGENAALLNRFWRSTDLIAKLYQR